ncbi:hypothetical protein RD792_013065 [Penstemon davidsonii]|uniref:Pectinesterase catalytic domain-containing protein n=1 Tax=Penstemon davidsonii TaxID=160366 RepID=A0ABR0CUJ8_9LAMI|nr:hypothetical protein RD792_013065 [Penstemon davidsonii]
MEGYQDTLWAKGKKKFYRNCYITSTIDFIFGDATTVFRNCLIYVRKLLKYQKNVVTTQGDFISAEGWLECNGAFALGISGRVRWSGYRVMKREEAWKFIVELFLHGDTWLTNLGVPVLFDLFI